MLQPFVHQATTTDFIVKNPRVLVTSDPGTGKTRSVIDAFAKRKEGRMLVLAPLSILGASWADDIKRFQPKLTSVIAYARNREDAFRSDAQIVIANHDASKWIAKHEYLLDGFTTICIDEFTAFKNKDSQRSKAVLRIMPKFKYRIAMSGTPNSNTILDMWHPTLLIDDGERLGRRFYGFRSAVCVPKFNGFANEWVDKPNAQDIVAAAIKDINVRFKLEECIDMPEKSVHTMLVDLTPAIMDQYNILAEDSVLYTGKSTINAINAGARVRKLLQLCTGAVYTEDGKAEGIHEERYDIVMQLVSERAHSLVAFNWRHEREHLVKLAEEMGFEHAVIDGDTPASKRKDIVDRMQSGQLKVVFAHPQSAGHGLTLTKATSVIWSSPTYNAEQYQQFNRRIYRAGQTQKTEVTHIAARNTWEPHVYEKLQGKLERMDELLDTLTSLTANRK